MKNLKLFGLLTIVALFFFTPQAQAINTADRAPLEAAISHQKLTKKELRQQKRMEKRMEKRLKKMQKKGVDFNDPVDKWMWFWIFGWGISLLIYILAYALVFGTFSYGLYTILNLIGALAGLFGTVSLVIWLVKKFG